MGKSIYYIRPMVSWMPVDIRGWLIRARGSLNEFVSRWRIQLHILVALLLMALIISGTVIGLISLANQDPYIVRSLALAVIAHKKAGEPIPFDPYYWRSEAIITEYGTESNSQWLLDRTRVIIPTLVYEGITGGDGVYPKGVFFFPLTADNHFHVAGRAYVNDNALILNERFLLVSIWNDEREALSTLIHELIHLQGGLFLGEDAEDFEARTQAATLEALAGLCNYGDQVACSAFWNEIFDYANILIRVRMNDKGIGVVYERMADWLFRDDIEEARAAKSLRFWKKDPGRLMYILRAYTLKPYRYHIIPGVRNNERMLVLDGVYSAGGIYKVNLRMSFDDTKSLIRFYRWLMLSPPIEGR